MSATFYKICQELVLKIQFDNLTILEISTTSIKCHYEYLFATIIGTDIDKNETYFRQVCFFKFMQKKQDSRRILSIFRRSGPGVRFLTKLPRPSFLFSARTSAGTRNAGIVPGTKRRARRTCTARTSRRSSRPRTCLPWTRCTLRTNPRSGCRLLAAELLASGSQNPETFLGVQIFRNKLQ